MSKLEFEGKISGTTVTGSEAQFLFDSQFVSLSEVIEKVRRQETMNWILDTLRFTKGEEVDGTQTWWCTIDFDTLMKLDIMEHHPDEEKQLEEYFGEDWMRQYIRFNH